MHAWSHADAELARVETEFAAVRPPVRRKRFTACRTLTHRSSQRDAVLSQRGAVLVALRRGVVAARHGECRTATWGCRAATRCVPRCDKADFRLRQDNDALRQGESQRARDECRAATRSRRAAARCGCRCILRRAKREGAGRRTATCPLLTRVGRRRARLIDVVLAEFCESSAGYECDDANAIVAVVRAA